jgi:hypothetical protein
MSEWIEHKGNRRPVNRDQLVNVQLRGGGNPEINIDAELLDWVHRGDRGDIVAYRLVNPPHNTNSK